MKIAQIAPLYEAVPPKLYGGTERVVHYLTEELVNLGHQVTLFASGDSKTSAQLQAQVPYALRLKNCEDALAPHIVQMMEVAERADEFDVLHFHNDYLNFLFMQDCDTPHVTTLHGKLDIPELQALYSRFRLQPVISISNNQRQPLPQANWVATIYHGLPKNLYSMGSGKGGYLAFLGRVSPEKGLDRAINIAKTAGITLKIAAKIDKADKEYYDEHIKPLLEHPLIEYIGEIDEVRKEEFLGNALALMFTINWNEPFGMVLIEAMACGTPVIAFKYGSVPELIKNEKNGFIVEDDKQALAALKKIHLLSRKKVRSIFEECFTARRMAMDYLALYQKLLEQNNKERIIPISNARTSVS